METPNPNASTGLEIASRLVKAVQFVVGLIVLALNVIGGYSVYLLWTVNKLGEFVQREVQSKLEFGWIVIALIVVVRLAMVAIGWILLVPIEARINGLNLRDREVAREVRYGAFSSLTAEALGLAVCVAVPLLIAFFRFGHFR